jgi:hypothetical protein
MVQVPTFRLPLVLWLKLFVVPACTTVPLASLLTKMG